MYYAKRIWILVSVIMLLLSLLRFEESRNRYHNIDHYYKLTQEQMKKDLDYLQIMITEVHPKTYGGVPPKIRQAIQQAYQEIEQIDNVWQFYFVTQQVMNSLKDGHSSILRPSDKIIEQLPFTYQWLEEGLYVTSSSGWLHRGDKIIAIGGKNEQELIEMLQSFVSYDNVHDLKRRTNTDRILTIAPYLEYFGLTDGHKVRVTVERSGKMILGEVDIQLTTNHPYHESKLFEYRVYKEDDLAVFRIDSFSPFNEYNKEVIQNFFETVKKEGVHQVVIDLRYNGGGSTMFGDYILSFLEIPSYCNLKTAVRYSPVVSQRVTGKPIDKDEMLYFESDPIPVKTHEYTFTGKLYIITSPDTYSAATALATVVKDNGIGMIVGEAPGGKPSSYGDILSFELPESKFRLFISFKWIERPYTTLKNHYEDTLQPDIYVPTTYEDLVQGRDPQLEMIKKLIREERQQERIPLSLR
ncbi:S41 family peptidase [Paenibacillus thiaminolyticus]|uniref:S41 family peptidase n=1 Tax=Paenibacillus thiaminolyticus TaxID=49283 RepID=UPI0025433105|nr:S41 family peptidase [Paenibacillus thiaminolyticus]WII35886.1 S41 family peptidase [Paenibacillus thiaminolyticus]